MSTPRDSLRWRLPLAVCIVLTLAMAAFAVTAYVRMQSILIESRGAHARVASAQVASLLAQSAQVSAARYTPIAAHPALRALVAEPSAANEQAARAHLTANAPPGLPASLEVWTSAGALLLTVAGPGGAAGSAGEAPASAAIVPIRYDNGVLYNQGAFAIPGPEGGGAAGYLLLRRPMSGNQTTVDFLKGMIGDDALIKVGVPDHLWTDLMGPVDPPPVVTAGTTNVRDSRAAGAVVATSAVAGSPLMASVMIPLDRVLAPARRLLAVLSVAALVVILLAAVTGYAVTGRITRPLGSLSDAAASIASGNLSHRVEVERSDEIGRLALAFNTMSDRIEEMHARLESRVEERTRELEAFSYSVSHDLRAPLRHIVGFAGLLERSSGSRLDDEGRRHLRTIAEAAGRMGRLIDDLLSFSRTGRAPLEARAVALGPLVADARREVMEHVPDRRVEWTVGELPDVWGDPALLRLAMLNVLSNAVKYTGTRDVARIDVSAGREGSNVVLRIADNGVGFDPAYASKLFGVFQRLHHAGEFEGTGIGLANVRQIVSRHGGRVWAEGAPGAGATFYLSLPSNAAAGASEGAHTVELT